MALKTFETSTRLLHSLCIAEIDYRFAVLYAHFFLIVYLRSAFLVAFLAPTIHPMAQLA